MRRIFSAAFAVFLATFPALAQQSVIGGGVYGDSGGGMITPIFAKASSTAVEPSNSVASFASIIGGENQSSFATSRGARAVPFPIVGNFVRIRAYFPQVLTQGSYNVTMNVGNVAASSNCTIDTTHQACSDDLFVAPTTGFGQLVAIETIPTGTPTLQTGTPEIALEFKSSVPNESFICAHTTTVNSAQNAAQNWTAFGGTNNWATTEINQSTIIPVAGVIDRFSLNTSVTIVAGSWDGNVYRNGSASVLDTGAISSGSSGSDYTHSVNESALDTISLSLTPTSTPTGGIWSACVRFKPTTPNQAIIANTFTSVPSTGSGNIRYGNFSGAFNNNSVTQANTLNIIPSFPASLTLSKFVAAESTAPVNPATRANDVLSGPTGGTINVACGFAATITSSSVLTIGGVANTPAVQDGSTNCAQTAGNSASTVITNSANTQAVVTWFKTSMAVMVQ